MPEVGVREFRDHLSRYLQRVRDGDQLVVTERGKAIARMVPIDGERPIDALVRAGVVTPARNPTRRRPAPLRTRGPVSDLAL